MDNLASTSIISVTISILVSLLICHIKINHDKNKILFEQKIKTYFKLIQAYRDAVLHHSSEETRQQFVMIQRQAQLLCSKDIKVESEKFFTTPSNEHSMIWDNLLSKIKDDLKLYTHHTPILGIK